MAKKNMEMKITVDDGARRVPICNTFGEEIGVFRFHPTDIGILNRFNDMMSDFEQITAPLEALEDDSEAGEAQRAEALKEAEGRLYAAVDKLFNGEGSAKALFGTMHPFSPVGGVFYCQIVLQTIGAFINEQFDNEMTKFSENVRKYTEAVK